MRNVDHQGGALDLRLETQNLAIGEEVPEDLLDIIVHLVLNFRLYDIKLRDCVRMCDRLPNEVMGLFQSLELHSVVLSQNVQRPQVLRRRFSQLAIRILAARLETVVKSHQNILDPLSLD